MSLFRTGIFMLLTVLPCFLFGQDTAFDSFISSVEKQYQVDVAIAPELIPTLDSIRRDGTEILNIGDLLHHLLNHSDISYQLIDGDKLMLRRESSSTSEKTKGTVVGNVVNKHNGEPMPYVSVFASASDVAGTTDEQGNFLLPLTDTTGFVEFSFLGFKKVRYPVSDALASSIRIALEVEPVALNKITIIVPYRLISQDHTNQSTDLKGYHLISEDQILHWNAEQLITNFTNYTHYSSDRGIRIRGVDVGNTMVVMDHIPVYDPYHYYNLFGPFNGLYFSSVSVYKNNLPIEYGGRIDGMINAESEREEVRSKIIFDTDLLQTGAMAEVALSPAVYFTGALRFSHTGIITPALSDSSVSNFTQPGRFKNEKEWTSSQQPETNFYDFNAGVGIKTGQSGSLRFNFFDSRDQLDNKIYTSFQTSILNHEVLSVEQSYASRDIWKNQGASAVLELTAGDRTTLFFETNYSDFDKDIDYESLLTEIRLGEKREVHQTGYQDNDLRSFQVKSYADVLLRENQSFKAGMSWQNTQVEFAARENKKPFLTQTQTEQSLSAFASYTNAVLQKLEWELGSRLTHLKSMQQVYFLPHVRLLYQTGPRTSLRVSYSKDLQSVRGITFENRFGRELNYLLLSNPSEGIPLLTANKYMLGFGYSQAIFSLDAEVFYKTMQGLARLRPLQPDPSDGPAEPSDFYRLFAGEGYTYGADITLVYKNQNTELSLYYTLSWLKERYPMLFQGNYFSPQEDRRHQVKFAGAQKMGAFKATTLITYKSPAPYLSQVFLENGGIGDANFMAVQDYLPAYFSLDIGLEYHFRLIRQPAMLGVSLINATNHRNVSDIQYLGRVPGDNGNQLYITNQTELLGRTFNVHFRFLVN